MGMDSSWFHGCDYGAMPRGDPKPRPPRTARRRWEKDSWAASWRRTCQLDDDERQSRMHA